MRPLTFKQIVQKFALINVRYSAPYKDGTGYFIGTDKSSAIYPYPSGPVVFTGGHADDDIVPDRVLNNWLHGLCLSKTELAMFWAARGAGEEPSIDTYL